MTSLLLPFLQKSSDGHIINVGCKLKEDKNKITMKRISGEITYDSVGVYVLSKYMMYLTSYKLFCLLGDKIRVNDIDPGHATTKLIKSGPWRWKITLPFYYLCFYVFFLDFQFFIVQIHF